MDEAELLFIVVLSGTLSIICWLGLCAWLIRCKDRRDWKRNHGDNWPDDWRSL